MRYSETSVRAFYGRASGQVVGAALLLMSASLFSVGGAKADDRAEYCFSNWQLANFAAGNLWDLQSRPGLIDHSTKCTVAGRTGHAAVGLGWRNGDLNVYTWVCNEDGSDCGIDGREDVQCMGEARTRDDEGTVLDDGSYGFVARIPSIGEQASDVPMDGTPTTSRTSSKSGSSAATGVEA